MTPGEFRLRFCYAKSGRLRYLSHLEVVHALERAIRRAGLPVAVTQGFSPHMKIAFGPALPVGTEGMREYLDVWLTRYTSAEEVLAALASVSPSDLQPLEACYVADNAPSLTAALTIGMYRIEVDGEELSAEQVREALARVMGTGELSVKHKGKEKVFDLARSVPKDVDVCGRDGGVEIRLAIRMGAQGSLRPEVLIRAALRSYPDEAILVRTTRLDTLTEDESGVWSSPV